MAAVLLRPCERLHGSAPPWKLDTWAAGYAEAERPQARWHREAGEVVAQGATNRPAHSRRRAPINAAQATSGPTLRTAAALMLILAATPFGEQAADAGSSIGDLSCEVADPGTYDGSSASG